MNSNEEAREIQQAASALAARAIAVLTEETRKLRESIALMSELPGEGLTPEIAQAAHLLARELDGANESLAEFRRLCEGEIVLRRKARTASK